MIEKTIMISTGLGASFGVFAPLLAQFPEYTALVAVSGFVGGAVRWMADRTHIWPSGLSRMVSGMMIAVFCWPLAQPMIEGSIGRVIELEPVQRVMFGGFVTGLLGLSLIYVILDIFKSRNDRLGVSDSDTDG